MNKFSFARRLTLCCGLVAILGGAARAESIWVTGFDNNTLTEYSLSSGAVLHQTTSNISTPDGLAVAPDGTLYVSNAGNASITHYSSVGTYLNTVTFTGGTPFVAPAGLRFDSSGNLYVSDNHGSAIQEFSLNSGGTTGNFVGTPITGLAAGGGIAFGPASPSSNPGGPKNTLYAGDFGTSAVYQAGNPSPYVVTMGTPSGLLFLPNGNLLVSNLFGNNILAFDSSGNPLSAFHTFPTPPAGFFPSYSPADLLLDPTTGNVIVDVLGYSQDPMNPNPQSGSIQAFTQSGAAVALPSVFGNLLSPSDIALVADVPEPSSVVALAGLWGMGLIWIVRNCRRNVA